MYALMEIYGVVTDVLDGRFSSTCNMNLMRVAINEPITSLSSTPFKLPIVTIQGCLDGTIRIYLGSTQQYVLANDLFELQYLLIEMLDL